MYKVLEIIYNMSFSLEFYDFHDVFCVVGVLLVRWYRGICTYFPLFWGISDDVLNEEISLAFIAYGCRMIVLIVKGVSG